MPVDRTRRFELPDIQDLNKDQDAALALPLEGQHLIIGGPGTGKSVVALLRARHLKAEKGERSNRFLAYNRLLDQSSRHLFGHEQSLFSRTLEAWFRDVWRHAFQGEVPTKKPNSASTFREIDWDAVERACLEEGLIPLSGRYRSRLPFLVIDEGQDMPPAFYSALTHLGFEDFYVVADQNQQIHPDKCSSRQDIENALVIEPSDTLELRTNYRNTRAIALLARHYYPHDPASPQPELPNAKPSALTPELWRYDSGGALTLAEVAARILQMADRDPRKLIGVIAPNNKVREKFVRALHEADPLLDNDRPPIQTYVSGSQIELDFGQGGIMVINAQSCKGLEFEVAILADIDVHQPQVLDVLMKRFYVMVSRARDQAILLRCGATRPLIDQLLPDDPTILARRDEHAEELEDDIPF